MSSKDGFELEADFNYGFIVVVRLGIIVAVIKEISNITYRPRRIIYSTLNRPTVGLMSRENPI